MTNEELDAALRLADEAERVAEKADPGPWQYNDFDGGPFKYCLTSEGYTLAELYEVREPDDDGVTQAQANGRFAAHARTSVPALASTVRGLVERVRECPAWHLKPTGPGVWVCEPEQGRDSAYVILDLDQESIDKGAPYHTARVFGPIVGCEAPVFPNRSRRKSEESTSA